MHNLWRKCCVFDLKQLTKLCENLQTWFSILVFYIFVDLFSTNHLLHNGQLFLSSFRSTQFSITAQANAGNFCFANGNRESNGNNHIELHLSRIFCQFHIKRSKQNLTSKYIIPYLNSASFLKSKNFLQLRDVSICKKFNDDGHEIPTNNLIALVLKLSGSPWDVLCQGVSGDRSKIPFTD